MKAIDLVLSVLVAVLAAYVLDTNYSTLPRGTSLDVEREIVDLRAVIEQLGLRKNGLLDELVRAEGLVAEHRQRRDEVDRMHRQLAESERKVKEYEDALAKMASQPEEEIYKEPKMSSKRRVKSVSVMVLVRDELSFGGEGRGIREFMETLGQLDYPHDKMHINFLVYYDYQLYDHLVGVLGAMNTSYTISVYRTDHDDWHRQIWADQEKDVVQQAVKQRKLLAMYRNKMIMRALAHEDYTLWMAPDVGKMPPDLLKTWVAFKVDAVTTLENSTVKPYSELQKWGFETMCNVGARDDLDRRKDELVMLDLAGGPLLLVKSELHRQGVNFPTFPLIGSMWEQVGTEGVEMDGICYMATAMGFACWGSPDNVTRHIAQPPPLDPWRLA
eukprot:comp23141_c1_seq1/m.37355 comp23141_c1_seq1/g.37355  ORF comp23141_c1_seq1/g.37355 comp23141_c1_seq1/m.37355 type:complete len:386 (-) comp23141_c1_seq1:451-1608(-)